MRFSCVCVLLCRAQKRSAWVLLHQQKQQQKMKCTFGFAQSSALQKTPSLPNKIFWAFKVFLLFKIWNSIEWGIAAAEWDNEDRGVVMVVLLRCILSTAAEAALSINSNRKKKLKTKFWKKVKVNWSEEEKNWKHSRALWASALAIRHIFLFLSPSDTLVTSDRLNWRMTEWADVFASADPADPVCWCLQVSPV